VTHNAVTGAIQGLPVTLDLVAVSEAKGVAADKLPSELEVRGEVFMTKADLELVSRSLEFALCEVGVCRGALMFCWPLPLLWCETPCSCEELNELINTT